MQASQNKKYAILTRILDEYVREGQGVKRRRSLFDTTTEEKQNQARARAFIHLYLASTYGLLDFEDRESTITDASNDGGIDGYFIDADNKIIDVIQSKFRVGSSNFESKNISPEELLAIDLDRILAGHLENAEGKKYNGYIHAFVEKVQKVPDIARYKTRVTILANVKSEQYPLAQRLFQGDQINIVNFERCYSELVMPTIRGEQHYSSSLRLQIDLSNKSNYSRLSAEINTAHGPSEVTVVLVPTLEIAQITSRFKNSILRYNPRSYLEFKEQRTNEGIRESIVSVETGEFAILNNGITMVSDDTYVSERVGTKNKAQIEIVNPQIINGGQTAFTLARIYDESSDIERARLFAGKEVVLRIITLPQVDEASKKTLILSISSATNSQTAVSYVDRTASNDGNRQVAEVVFAKTGLLYEPKRGEYADALRSGFITENDIVDRTIFTRLMSVANGRYALAVERRIMRSTGGIIPPAMDGAVIDRFLELHTIYSQITKLRPWSTAADKVTNDLAFTVLVRGLLQRRRQDGLTDWLPRVIAEARELVPDFELWASENVEEFMTTRLDKTTQVQKKSFAHGRWRKSARYVNDVDDYVRLLEITTDEVGPETATLLNGGAN
ncbi:AIPR family protein [Devosia aquimaris]|uniref:AIPR family protein n=1 Tax=Devosia aquimaris TaxID=2866214 RepID=UPI001CD0F1B3|nr:AIPR family protein [Devosia sp. CJK-A8-3]